jgi:hypothetical protein
VGADQDTADRAGHVCSRLAGQVVDAFLDQDGTWGVEVQRVAPGGVLQVSVAHRALLEKGGRGSALPESRQGFHGVVAHDDPGVREDKCARGRLEGKDAAEGLVTNLVLNVLRVGKGSDDDLSVEVVPPSDDGSPAVDRGVPGDGDHPGVTRLAGGEGVVQGAGDRRPEGAARLSVVLEHLTDEDSRLANDKRDRDRRVVDRVAVRADDRGEEGDKWLHVGRPAE